MASPGSPKINGLMLEQEREKINMGLCSKVARRAPQLNMVPLTLHTSNLMNIQINQPRIERG